MPKVAMTKLSTLNDEELLRGLRAGDENAFLAIYRLRQRAIYRFAFQMSGSETIAEDVTQEVFMALMSEQWNFDATRGSLSAYLFGIARNQVLRALGKERAHVSITEDPEHGSAHSPSALVAEENPLADATRSETIESVRNAVMTLPSHYREVIVLCELHEMSYAEAAQVIGCVVGTVRSRLHRARALLLEKLQPSEATESLSRSADATRCFA